MILRYTAAVEGARPGIAKANRPRGGAFASLLDQVLQDEAALDGMVFAYEELPAPERLAMALAVAQDAARPAQVLAALLSVEEEPRLRARLGALLVEHAELEQAALRWGTAQSGGAVLIQTVRGSEPEMLRVTWNHCQISEISVEPRADSSFEEASADTRDVVEAVAPMLWHHIRTGGPLPDGIERFASFF